VVVSLAGSQVAMDDLNLAADKDRRTLIERLPEHLRQEAGPLIEELAVEVVRTKSRVEPTARALPGSSLVLCQPEPVDDPVDGIELLAELTWLLKRFMVLPPLAAEAMALWILHAYAHDAFEVSPILAITSPEKRCGKTTLLEVLSTLVPRPLPTANISAAAVFRTIEHDRPTLLIDEMDTVLDTRDGPQILRGILNSGHKRMTAKVIRTAGEDHEPRGFSTWCPKVLAKIGVFPDTLDDRSIHIRLQRRTKNESVERMRITRLYSEVALVRRRCVRWVNDNFEKLRDADPVPPDELSDRAADNWRPLLAVAEAVVGAWATLCTQAALELSGKEQRIVEHSAAVTLLADLRRFYKSENCTRLTSARLIQLLLAQTDAPWSTWKHGRPITAADVATLLKPFGVSSKPMRVKQGILRGYELEGLKGVFARYLPPEPQRE
jgi:hypothetical protein